MFQSKLTNPIIRYDPSILTICMNDYRFKPIKILYNKDPVNNFYKMYYSYLLYCPTEIYPELDPNYFDVKHLNNYYIEKKWKTSVLDIQNLTYPFKTIKVPTFFEGLNVISHKEVTYAYEELETLKTHFNIKHPIDAYQIDKNVFIQFDNKDNFISE